MVGFDGVLMMRINVVGSLGADHRNVERLASRLRVVVERMKGDLCRRMRLVQGGYAGKSCAWQTVHGS